MPTEFDSFAYNWRRLNVIDAHWLLRRWINQGPSQFDPLVASAPKTLPADPAFVWRVTSQLYLLRLIGALQHANPRCTLWFRGVGEAAHAERACPARSRPPKSLNTRAFIRLGLEWIAKLSYESHVFKNRGPLARLAILQHYGARTSFLDVTRDYRVGMFFAFTKLGPCPTLTSPPAHSRSIDPHLMVFATPRVTASVNDFAEAGLCVVDLLAEMPSYCLRPHGQHAGFIGLRETVRRDLDYKSLRGVRSTLDAVCIARIKLDFDPLTKINVEEMFPPASENCKFCRGKAAHD